MYYRSLSAPGRRLAHVVLAGVLAAVAAVTPGSASQASTPAAECSQAAPTEDAAVQMALRCGTEVVVDSSRNEYTQVVAAVSGTLRLESAVVPVRARTADGSWKAVDLDLHVGTDGLIRPKVSASDVRFSAGGTGPLVSLVGEGSRLELSWPSALPQPTIAGDSATYASVLPDVDLVVRATRTGFTHVLVIKNAAAAANPAVRTSRFRVSGNVEVRELGDKSLRVTAADGSVVARANRPLMWDSSKSATEGMGARGGGVDDPAPSDSDTDSSPAGAGDAARVAPVAVELTAGGELVLTPDAELLSAATFPLYVDPAWDEDDNKWAYATNGINGNDDYTSARVGLNPETGKLFRSFFEFPMTDENGTTLKGKQIKTARVQMTLDNSYSCTDTDVNMYRTSAIDKTMRATWSKMALAYWLDQVAGHANEKGGCGVLYNDMIMNFGGPRVVTQVQASVNANWDRLTVGFCACTSSTGANESDQARWKRFDPAKAFLVVEFNTAPTAPTDLRFGTFTCPAVAELTNPPKVGATSVTIEALANDADGGTADVTFRKVEIPAGTTNPDTLTGYTDVTYTSKPVNSKPSTQTPNASRVQSPLTGLVEGKTYGFKVKSRDPNTVTGFSADSPWSQWCVFAVDVSIPPAPAVTSSNCPEDQTTTVGPGETCNVTLTTTATDAAYFEYWFEGQSHRTVAVDADLQVDVQVTPIRYGLNTLRVFVVDTIGHPSEAQRSFSFYVAAPSKPIAHWNLEQLPPAFDQTEALKDVQGTPTNLTTFTGTWDADTRMVGARTAGFNGTQAAATAGPVVSTTGSFSVSAWVRLSAVPTDDAIAVTQDGSDAAGFQLGSRMVSGAPRWSFIMKDTAAQSSATKAVSAQVDITTADVGQWTHIAGVYDANAKKIRVYVNGALVGGGDRTVAPWASNGKFAVGRGFASGVASKYFKGSIADVRAWNRALVAEDFTPLPVSGDVGLVDHDTVGLWNFDTAAMCLPTVCPTIADDSSFTRELQMQPGTLTGPDQSPASEICQIGGRTSVVVFDTCDLEYGEYGTSGPESGATIKDYGTVGVPDWRRAPVVRTDTSFTVSAWVRPQEDSLLSGCRTVIAQDATVTGGAVSGFFLKSCTQVQAGTTTARWMFSMPNTAATAPATVVSSVDPIASSADAGVAAATAGRWTFLAAVYDGSTREIRLYVNGVLQATAVRPANTAWNATGALTLGRGRWSSAQTPAGYDTDFYLGGLDQISIYAGVLDQTAIDQAYATEGESGA